MRGEGVLRDGAQYSRAVHTHNTVYDDDEEDDDVVRTIRPLQYTSEPPNCCGQGNDVISKHDADLSVGCSPHNVQTGWVCERGCARGKRRERLIRRIVKYTRAAGFVTEIGGELPQGRDRTSRTPHSRARQHVEVGGWRRRGRQDARADKSRVIFERISAARERDGMKEITVDGAVHKRTPREAGRGLSVGVL
nr:hypothetical protein CFP56_19531 [Quercus suber]